MKKLRLYAAGAVLVFGVGVAAGIAMGESDPDADKSPQELSNQRAAVSQVIAEETEGRLLDTHNAFDAARFVTKAAKVELNIDDPDLRRAEADGRMQKIIFPDALAAAGVEAGKDKRMNALVACAIRGLQSGEPNETMFQQSTLDLYAQAPNHPGNYDVVQNRCLGSVASRIAGGQIVNVVYPWKAAA